MFLNSAFLYGGALVLWIVGIFFGVGTMAAHLDDKFIVASAFFVSGGVLLTSAVKLHSEERDRAFKFLTENQNNLKLLEAMSLIGRVRGNNLDFSETQAKELYLSKDPTDVALRRQIFEVGNFFEEMAIGIKYKQINEGILMEFYRGVLYRFGSFLIVLLPIIRNTSKLPDHPFGPVPRPEIFKNLEELYIRWSKHYEHEFFSKADPYDSQTWTGR